MTTSPVDTVASRLLSFFEEVAMVKIAVLDDYVNNAATSADWSDLPPDTSVDFFHDPLPVSEAGSKLKDYEVIVTMRERMPFPAALLRQLSNTKLIMCNGR